MSICSGYSNSDPVIVSRDNRYEKTEDQNSDKKSENEVASPNKESNLSTNCYLWLFGKIAGIPQDSVFADLGIDLVGSTGPNISLVSFDARFHNGTRKDIRAVLNYPNVDTIIVHYLRVYSPSAMNTIEWGIGIPNDVCVQIEDSVTGVSIHPNETFLTGVKTVSVPWTFTQRVYKITATYKKLTLAAPILGTPTGNFCQLGQNITLNWSPGYTLSPGCFPITFRVEVSVNANMANPFVSEIKQSNVTSHLLTNLQAGTYYWRVTIYRGLNSAQSPIRMFTIANTSNFSLLAPANGAICAGLKPTFTWGAVAGCSPTTIKYQLLVYQGANTTPVINVSNLTTTSYISTTSLLQYTNYRWKVVATDASTPVNSISTSEFTFATFTTGCDPQISLTSPNGGETWQAGTSRNIQWNYGNINNVKLEYSTNNGSNWSTLISSTPAITGQYTWTVSGNQSNNCFVRISDASNPSVNDMNKTPFTIFEYPGSVSLIKTFFFGDISDKSNYKIIGVPGNVNIPVQWTTQGSHKYDWNVFWDDGSNSNYQIEYTESDLFKFRPGRAFWLLSRYAVAVSTEVNSVLIDESFLYSIPLHPGWNLISNPFEKNVSWSAVQSVNTGIQPIHDFNKTYSTASTFEPYKGYYFNNVTNLSSLKIPYPVTGAVPTIVNKNNSEETAYIKMWITGTEGEKASVEIFNDLNGARGFDTGDIFAPPGNFEKLKISIRNNGIENPYKYLMRDNRNLAEEEEIDVVIKNLTDNIVRLMTELPEKPMHEKLYLVEKIKGKFTDLLSEERVFVSPNNPGSEFVLLMGSESFIESKKNEYLPKDFMLYQNYPNPFNPATVISYQLSVNSFVSLKLFDILGNEVAVLVDMEQAAGFYEYKLSALDLKLSSGVYFYQLKAGEFLNTKKMVILK